MNKVGVEVSFKVCSPMIKEIRVVKRAEKAKGAVRDLGRAKVNYLRDKPQMLGSIASALKQQQRK